MALVAYSDSEEEGVEEAAAPPREALPPLDLAPAGYQNEWLSYAFLPGTSRSNAVPIDHALRQLLQRSCPPSWTLLPADDALHISLTRPIILRKHEGPLFTQCVDEAFACFASDTSPRIFLSLETNAGWHEMASLTQALDRRLHTALRAPVYYTQPRFHASIAYRAPNAGEERASVICEGERWVDTLNTELGATLRAHTPIAVHAAGAQVGKHVAWLPMNY